jgi:hypothetical protein
MRGSHGRGRETRAAEVAAGRARGRPPLRRRNEVAQGGYFLQSGKRKKFGSVRKGWFNRNHTQIAGFEQNMLLMAKLQDSCFLELRFGLDFDSAQAYCVKLQFIAIVLLFHLR